MKYLYYLLIPASLFISCTDITSIDDDIECSSLCQVESFLLTQSESPPENLESMAFFESKGRSFGILLYDVAEHPDNDMMRYQKALLFQFDEYDLLKQEETLVLDIFIENKAVTSDFIDVAKQFYLDSQIRSNVNGAVIVGDIYGEDQRFLKFEKGSFGFTPIEDSRNDARENSKDCYTAWFGYYNQYGVFTPVYALYTWCTHSGGGGGGGSGSGGSPDPYPQVCNLVRQFGWNDIGPNYTTQVNARITKTCASCWPSANLFHTVSGSHSVSVGTIHLSVFGGYDGNGRVSGRASARWVISILGNTVTNYYSQNFLMLFGPSCY